jgi:hypothetical protein
MQFNMSSAWGRKDLLGDAHFQNMVYDNTNVDLSIKLMLMMLRKNPYAVIKTENKEYFCHCKLEIESLFEVGIFGIVDVEFRNVNCSMIPLIDENRFLQIISVKERSEFKLIEGVMQHLETGAKFAVHEFLLADQQVAC